MFASKAQHLRGSATIKSANSRRSFKVSAVSVNTGIKKTDLKDGKFVFESDTKGRDLDPRVHGRTLRHQQQVPAFRFTASRKNAVAFCHVHEKRRRRVFRSRFRCVVFAFHFSIHILLIKHHLIIVIKTTEFDLKTGANVGEWCPKVPTLPVIGKPMAGEPKPAEVYPVSVDENSGEIVLEL